MLELPRTDEVIYSILSVNRKYYSTDELQKLTRFHRRNVQISLNRMHESGLLNRIKGEGNSWLYSLDGIEPTFTKKDLTPSQEEKPIRKTPKKTKGISNTILEKFLRSMVKGRWEHPLFNKKMELNRNVLRLYNLAFEGGTGSTITEEDLQEIKRNIEDLLRLHMTYVDLLSSLIEQDYLWDPENFGVFLLQNYSAIEIRDMVSEARKNN